MLADKIKQNQEKHRRFKQTERILRAVRLNIFKYEDEGKLERAYRVMELCKARLKPLWDARTANLKAKTEERLLFRTE